MIRIGKDCWHTDQVRRSWNNPNLRPWKPELGQCKWWQIVERWQILEIYRVKCELVLITVYRVWQRKKCQRKLQINVFPFNDFLVLQRKCKIRPFLDTWIWPRKKRRGKWIFLISLDYVLKYNTARIQGKGWLILFFFPVAPCLLPLSDCLSSWHHTPLPLILLFCG